MKKRLLFTSMLMGSTAQAELPLPVFPECEAPYSEDVCPDDLDAEWWMISTIPEYAQDTIREAELDFGSGCWADQAWRVSTGNFSTLVAVGDSGIEWDNNHLVNKVFLNTRELPLPKWVVDGNVQYFETHDADGNGLVNVQDYAHDDRVPWEAGVEVADDRLDASDLIAVFSDGVDDDGNGYVDDIAGWDFFADDNDPWNTFDEGYGTHGSGVMEDVGAEGGDDNGKIGVCPNCALLPLRVGDTFVVDGGRVAEAIAYAADMDAAVMALAVGALSHPGLIEESIDYAHDQDMLLVGAAGDENSYHHNFPAVHGDFLYVHSVKNDSMDREDAYSFLNFFNCNNYGPRIDLVAQSPACATGAVAIISGVAGLVHSIAEDLGVSLDVDELRTILVQAGDDIWLTPEEVARAETYPSSEGWDPFYGYGRINAARAVNRVVEGDIPPVARITSPEWFELVDPSQRPSISVAVSARAERSTSYSWTLSWGGGWEPTEWTAIDGGTGSDRLEELSVPFDLSTVPVEALLPPERDEGVLDRVERVHKPAVTFLLTVTDAEGRSSESRRTIYVYEDNDLLSGFPQRLEGSGESSPVLADFDGDGVFEVAVGGTSGQIRVLNGQGRDLPGWPVWTDPIASVQNHADAASYQTGAVDVDAREPVSSTVAVGDLDGDGDVELVAAGGYGRVYAFHSNGELVEGFPLSLIRRQPEEFDTQHTYDNGFLGAPTLIDLDGDRDLEIVLPGMDSRLYVWHHTGEDFANYPIEVCHPENCGSRGARIITSVSVGDLEGDGDLDFVFGGNETTGGDKYSVTHAFDALSGAALPGWPIKDAGLVNEAALLPLIGKGHPASVALGDLDQDGTLEIVDAIMLGQTDVLDHQGEVFLDLAYAADKYGVKSDSNEPSFVAMSANPALGDVNGDGVLDPVMGGAGTYAVISLALSTAIDFQHVLGGWDGATGEFLEGWPRQVEDFQFLVAPAIADVSGDGEPEVIYTSAGYVVGAWDASGRIPEGWPKFTGQWVLGSPAVGDITGDGYLDVVTTTREGWIFAWSTQGRADQPVQWASMHHDAQNTGNAHTDIPAQAGPAAEGCCKSKQGPEHAWVLGPFLVFFLGRRREA
ncbi:MAG: FG-GAP-like repeat-containing protein [Myxococcota bacterium]|nr:FG-GAP-like repeat-containing protein [Myxococcota bacterium]